METLSDMGSIPIISTIDTKKTRKRRVFLCLMKNVMMAKKARRHS